MNIHSQIIIDYELFHGKPAPKTTLERFTILSGISQQDIIIELKAINYKFANNNFWRYLKYFTGNRFLSYGKRILDISKQYQLKPVIFNRAATLLAIQEIASQFPNTAKTTVSDQDMKLLILGYYFTINQIITKYKPSLYHNLEEQLLANSAFIAKIDFQSHYIYTMERFYELVKFLKNDEELTEKGLNRFFSNYFRPIGFDAQYFLFQIINILQTREVLLKVHESNKELFAFFAHLSARGNGTSLDNLDITELKKSPLFHLPNNPNIFLLLDESLLVDKIYQTFIDDYLFDYIKPNIPPVPNTNENGTKKKAAKEKAAEEKGAWAKKISHLYLQKIGEFLEHYVSKKLNASLDLQKFTIKSLDELKYKKGDELADFSILDGNKIAIGQVKKSKINSSQIAGNPTHFFKVNEEGKGFYDNFGYVQIEKSLKWLDEQERSKVFGLDFSVTPMIEVYPIIVLNDTISSSPFLIKAFQEKLDAFLIANPFKHLKVMSLVIMHIQDLEIMCDYEKINERFWEILNAQKDFSPFYHILNGLKIFSNKPILNFLVFLALYFRLLNLRKKIKLTKSPIYRPFYS